MSVIFSMPPIGGMSSAYRRDSGCDHRKANRAGKVLPPSDAGFCTCAGRTDRISLNMGDSTPVDRLSGKVAIVTGAGTRPTNGDFEPELVGTGRATAIRFAQEAARVLLVDKSAEQAERTLAEILKAGGEASIYVGDVSDVEQCRRMVDAAVERYGSLHILVNNVGIGGRSTFPELTEERWSHILDVNLKSMAFATKFAIPAMIESGGGSIINFSSVDGIRTGVVPNVPYSVSKGGVISLTRSTAVYHGRDNIRANCIAPGHIYTPMMGRISDDYRQRRRRSSPLGTEGTGWDVANAAVFLASDEARWITGVVLPVDAGLLATVPLNMYPYLLGDGDTAT